MDNIIQIRQLTKIYIKSHLGRIKKTVGVRDLDLDIRENEVFGLLGLNGSGKTTTIKLILGLLKPTSGEIRVLNRKLPDRSVLGKIGYLPETPYFQKYLTGREILRFYCNLSGIKEYNRRIEEVVEVVKLKEHIGKKISEFSKGMLQRLGIAQSLLSDPPLLIYDEPSSGLDPVGMREIRDFINVLKERKKTVLFSSHIISEVEKICDRVGILHEGKLISIIEKESWMKNNLENIFIEKVT